MPDIEFNIYQPTHDEVINYHKSGGFYDEMNRIIDVEKKQNPKTLYFKDLKFDSQDFSNCKFCFMIFENITFNKCNLTNVNFEGSLFLNCKFEECEGTYCKDHTAEIKKDENGSFKIDKEVSDQTILKFHSSILDGIFKDKKIDLKNDKADAVIEMPNEMAPEISAESQFSLFFKFLMPKGLIIAAVIFGCIISFTNGLLPALGFMIFAIISIQLANVTFKIHDIRTDYLYNSLLNFVSDVPVVNDIFWKQKVEKNNLSKKLLSSENTFFNK